MDGAAAGDADAGAGAGVSAISGGLADSLAGGVLQPVMLANSSQASKLMRKRLDKSGNKKELQNEGM